MLTPRVDAFGYPTIKLYKNGKKKWYKIHRIVALAFIPNPENKQCIDHINTNKKDNRVENLRWCTVKENVNNPLSKQHQRESAIGRKHSEESKTKMSLKRRGKDNIMYGKNHTRETKIKMSIPIVQYSINGEYIREFIGATEAFEITGIHRQNISDALKGRRKQAGGFLWKYKKIDQDA